MGKISKKTPKSAASQEAQKPAAPPKPAFDMSAIRVGIKVYHKAFGSGTITGIDPEGTKFRYVTVQFENDVKKFLIPQAFLQKFLIVEA